MIPVTILTGFLGSGKTTILARLLRRPELADTVVIINEWGEIGLDHLLVQHSEENLILLTNGCLCCTVRGDLIETIEGLEVRVARGDIQAFARVVIETTGLADPAPILHSLMADPKLARQYRLEGVITAIDSVNGAATLAAHPTAVKQVAVADRLLLTKTDLASDAPIAQLRALNPGAPILEVIAGQIDPAEILAVGLYDAAGKSTQVRRWLHDEAHAHHHDDHRHDSQVQSYCVVIDQPVAWADFTYWLELLAAMRGEEMLRVKGIVAVAEHPDRPFVIHGVQHVFHPPVQLEAWPSDDQRTRMVFITRNVPRSLLEATLQRFAKVAKEAVLF
jgi:G3E family GTPase